GAEATSPRTSNDKERHRRHGDGGSEKNLTDARQQGSTRPRGTSGGSPGQRISGRAGQAEDDDRQADEGEKELEREPAGRPENQRGTGPIAGRAGKSGMRL